MKPSLWNSYISLDEKSGLIFNAISDSFIFTNVENILSIKNGNLNSIDAKLKKAMIAHKMIVQSKTNEVEELQKKIELIDNDDSCFQLLINPTLDCNFKCWYCYEKHINGSCMSKETCNNVLKLVNNIINNNNKLKYFYLSFFGGEPILQFDKVAKNLISEISALCTKYDIKLNLHFTTNGALLTKDIISFLQIYDTSFQITLDGGKEDHDKTRFWKGGFPSFDIIWKNIIELASNHLQVLLRVNYTQNNIIKAVEIVDRLKNLSKDIKKYITVDYHRVWQDGSYSLCDDTYKNAKRIRNILKHDEVKTVNNRILDGVNNSCYGDKRNLLLINYNGDVYCCTARDFNKENRLGVLSDNGNVIWDGSAYEHRMNSKFVKPVCHKCRIAPLCGGGCRTQAVEHYHENECIYGYSDTEIDSFILERFEERFM